MQAEPVLPDEGFDMSRDRIYPLQSIYFYLTEGCNLRCRHCWIEPKFQGGAKTYSVLDIGLFRSVLEQGKSLGLTGVKLSGGEPLLHPQIDEILGLLRRESLHVGIETNGVLMTADLARRIAESAQRFVAVSVDGAHAPTHEWVRGVEGSFEATLRGIRHLVEAGIQPQVIMSVMRKNVNEMEPVVRLVESLGASSVKFNMVLPTARGEQMHEAGETLDIEELIDLGDRVENDLAKRVNIPLYLNHPLAFRPLGSMFGDRGNCAICNVLGIIGVLSDGSYALCGIGTSVPELVFGHAGKDSLSAVWRNAPALKELREGMPRRLEGVCGDCIMKDMCLGSCIAQNYYASRNLWASYWFCEEARVKGLFPESRITSGLQRRAGEIAESRPAAGTVLR